jgi:hypothetical protein
MTLRQEASKYIENIPENKLEIIVPLLRELFDSSFVIETNLTKKEKKVIADGVADYDNGVKFIPLETLK